MASPVAPADPPPADPQFESVVQECYDDVYRFACSLTQGNSDAADLTQQAFLRYARKGKQVRDRGKIKSWLFSVLRNEFTDIQRRKSRYQQVEIDPARDTVQVAEAASDHTDWNTALTALRALPPTFREPLALYYLEGYTYQEIATALQLPVGTVMSRLSRGKVKLRALLEGSF